MNSPMDLSVEGGQAHAADQEEASAVFAVKSTPAPITVQISVSPVILKPRAVQGRTVGYH